MTESRSHQLLAEAIVHSQEGRTSEAIGCLERAVSVPDSGADAFHLLAAEYVSVGRLDEAEAAFAAVLLREPERWVARFQLGLLQVTSGRSAAGQLTWMPLLSLPQEQALRHYVEGYFALLNDHLSEATASFAHGLTLPQDNQALMGDIRKTIQAIADLTPVAAGSRDGAQAEGNVQHVLLSNYSSGQTRH